MTAQPAPQPLPESQQPEDQAQPVTPALAPVNRLEAATQLINATIDELHREHPEWPMARLRGEALELARPQLPEGIEVRTRRERRKEKRRR